MKEAIRRLAEDSGHHISLMATMRDGAGSQDSPKVGIFWYNPERNRLVGVRSAYAKELAFNPRGRKTLTVLHHTEWPSVREDAIANGSTDEIWTEEDYTQVPRGRVFQTALPGSDAEYFEVLVGSWLRQYPQAGELIRDQFNLRHADHDIIEDGHWDIGRGLSEIFM